jgi:hypothetical protein
MFDLEQFIADWRHQMLAAGVKTPVPLEELELHLREDVEEQRKSGLSEPQAFAAAVRRIGPGKTLNAEFTKCGCLRERREELLKYLALGCSFLAYGGFKLMWFRAFLKSDAGLAWRLAGWADIALSGLIVISLLNWRRTRRAFSVIGSHRACLTAGVVFGLVAVVGWAIIFVASGNFLLPYVNFTQGAMLVIVAWYFTSLVGSAVVLAGVAGATKLKLEA